MSNTSEQQLEQHAQILATQLLDAQVAFIKSRLASSEAPQYIAKLIDFCLLEGQFIQLEDIVHRDSVKQVVQTYAFDLNLGGGILELIGAIGQRVYQVAITHPASLQTLINNQILEQWIEKILELEQLRTHLHDAIQNNPSVQHFIEQLTASLIKKQLPDWHQQLNQYLKKGFLAKTPISKKIGQLWFEQEDKLLGFAESQISALIQNQIRQILLLDPSDLKDIIWEVWESIKHVPLSEFYNGIHALDIEEFFVLSYELWRHLRQTDYLQHMVLTGVDVFFEIYGAYPVAELLEEIGITREHILNDANRFLPTALQTLNQHHFLDKLIHLQLKDFYHSDATLQLIKNNL